MKSLHFKTVEALFKFIFRNKILIITSEKKKIGNSTIENRTFTQSRNKT